MEAEVLDMQKMVNCEASSVWLLDEETIYPYVCTGPKKNVLKNVILNAGEGLCGYCIEHNEEIICNDIQNDSRWCFRADEITGFKTRSIICIPIVINNEVYGCVELVNKREGDFTQEDIKVCKDIVEYMEINI